MSRKLIDPNKGGSPIIINAPFDSPLETLRAAGGLLQADAILDLSDSQKDYTRRWVARAATAKVSGKPEDQWFRASDGTDLEGAIARNVLIGMYGRSSCDDKRFFETSSSLTDELLASIFE